MENVAAGLRGGRWVRHDVQLSTAGTEPGRYVGGEHASDLRFGWSAGSA